MPTDAPIARVRAQPPRASPLRVLQVEAVAHGTLCFRFDSGEMIVVSADKCWASESDIFRTHCISQRASPDLM